jgi:hypothetical protein
VHEATVQEKHCYYEGEGKSKKFTEQLHLAIQSATPDGGTL